MNTYAFIILIYTFFRSKNIYTLKKEKKKNRVILRLTSKSQKPTRNQRWEVPEIHVFEIKFQNTVVFCILT